MYFAHNSFSNVSQLYMIDVHIWWVTDKKNTCSMPATVDEENHRSVMVESISSWFHLISVWNFPQPRSNWLPPKGSDIIPKQQLQPFFSVTQTLPTHSPLTRFLPHWKNWWEMGQVILAVLCSYSVHSLNYSSIGPPPLFAQIDNFISTLDHHTYLFLRKPYHLFFFNFILFLNFT